MQEKANIGSLFNRIAANYDRFNHITSAGIDRRWRYLTVRSMRPAQHVLDVAIGTGDLAIEMLKRGKAQQVTGIDLSTEMMRVGAAKVSQYDFAKRVRFDEGSALEMPYENEQFDAVTCAYGVRNFSNLDKGLAEMYRVLRPGGQLLILEFSYPENPIVRWAYDLYFSHVMPLLGKLISKDQSAYTYFLHSVKNFIWGEEMLTHLRDAGFSDTHYRTITFGITTLYTATK